MTKPWYRSLVETTAQRYGLDPDLVEAFTWQESSGQAHAFRYEPGFYSAYIKGKPEWRAISDPQRVASSYGLMQVMYPTAVQFGFSQEPEYLFVPSVNLDYGCKVIRNLLDWAGSNVWKAVAAYNGGKGNWNGEQPQKYAASVRNWYVQVQQRGK